VLLSQLNIDELRQTVWMIVLEESNLLHMQAADPINLEPDFRGGFLEPPKYPLNMSVLIAYETDRAPLYQLSHSGDLAGLVNYLERGRRLFAPPTPATWLLKAHGEAQ
jgi:hypothetical protein